MSDDKIVFYTVYGSEHCKEPIDKLMYGLSLDEFLDLQNYVEIQNSFDKAISLDADEKSKRDR